MDRHFEVAWRDMRSDSDVPVSEPAGPIREQMAG